MNRPQHIEEQLSRVGSELGDRPAFVADVMTAIQKEMATQPPRTSYGRATRWIATAACGLLIASAVWLSQPKSLYAETIAALKNVTTVHVTGTVSKAIRKWPLEERAETTPADGHEVSLWYWSDESGSHRAYEEYGPVTLTRNGPELHEYQSDADLAFKATSSEKDYVDRFASLATFLEAMKDDGAKVESLGTRSEASRTLLGMKYVRGPIVDEYWFDEATNLPVRHQRSSSRDGTSFATFALRFQYDQSVPQQVASYTPPAAKRQRFGMQKNDAQRVWTDHVDRIAEMSSTAEGIQFVPRERSFALQYMKQASAGSNWVLPVDIDQYQPMDVKHFIRLRVAGHGGERSIETWRIPEDLLDLEFPRGDVVMADGTPWQESTAYVLAKLGLEYVDVVEDRTFWIAKHDGRKLKPYAEVHPPVARPTYADGRPRGSVETGMGYQLRAVTMDRLLTSFNQLQNRDFNGRHPIVVNATGLPTPPKRDAERYPTWTEYTNAVSYEDYLVATDAPYFRGKESLPMARNWYEQEFGVTFEEETRPVTMHVVRRKK